MTQAVQKRAGRPPKALAAVGAKPLRERVALIVDHHAQAQTHAAQAVLHAIFCGMELIAARREVPDGEWTPWIETNVPFSSSTVYKYMDAAEKQTKAIPELTKIAGWSLGVSPATLPEKQRLQLIQAVSEATDGETMAAILGKGKRTYDHIGGNAKLRAWLAEHHPESKARAVEELTEEQVEEWEEYEAQQRAVLAERKNALDRSDWNGALANLNRLIERRKFAILTRTEIENSAAILQDMREALLKELRK